MQGDHTLGRVRFHDLLRHSGVGLDPKKITLGETISGTHTTRNHMQHANAAATVDEQHCADAILDAVAVIDHCFHGTSSGLSDSLKVMLRVVRLHSSNGNPAQRNAFDEAMRSHSWRGQRERAKFNESIVSPGMRVNWGLVIPGEYATVEYILNRLGVS